MAMAVAPAVARRKSGIGSSRSQQQQKDRPQPSFGSRLHLRTEKGLVRTVLHNACRFVCLLSSSFLLLMMLTKTMKKVTDPLQFVHRVLGFEISTPSGILALVPTRRCLPSSPPPAQPSLPKIQDPPHGSSAFSIGVPPPSPFCTSPLSFQLPPWEDASVALSLSFGPSLDPFRVGRLLSPHSPTRPHSNRAGDADLSLVIASWPVVCARRIKVVEIVGPNQHTGEPRVLLLSQPPNRSPRTPMTP
ncbi:hypothetical protein IE53DRAFT_213342 [Violaceomyces palustris]|uniref:Uncharacterized protein n=1 Tax=Violaceomyces palustris TaxID=1673888 RepID=A0ACD0P4R9_9BASI|nr:hypothetical protein IE53DRAFT_213342 [Violaceomyces palustris]